MTTTISTRNALVSLPADVLARNGRIIGIDGGPHSATCDLCHLLWPARSLAFRGAIGTLECPLCTPESPYLVFIDNERDPVAFVAEADALAYADEMAARGHRVLTDACSQIAAA